MKKNLLTVCLTLIMGLMCSCGTKETKAYNKGINIIPKPLSLVENEGQFTLKNNMTFLVPNEDAKKVAEFFTDKIKSSTGFDVRVYTDKEDADFSFALNQNLEVNNEGYELAVTNKNVQIQAKTLQGFFYAMQSFMQLLPAEIENSTKVTNVSWTAKCVSIKDEPRFHYRGVMIDVCRHFMPVEAIKRQLDVMSLFKINRFHWHLTEDQGWRIEIKKYPKLTEIGSKRIDGEGKEYGGYYTQEQIKEIVAYAADRFITVVPELEVPGHELAAISAYPYLSCRGTKITPRIIWGVEDVVMCPGKESTFEFLEDVITEMVELFPGEYFHIGGDECPKTSWKKCPLCQKRIRQEGLKADKKHSAEERLQSYVIQRVGKILAKHGKKLIGWDEILEGGLAPSATVMSWRGEQGGIAAAKMNHDVIMTPGSGGLYIDHYQGDSKVEPVAIGGYAPLSKTYSYNPVPKALSEMNKEEYVKGVQCNMWTEYIYNTDLLEYRLYPRVVALSEVAWSSLENKNFEDFSRRIENASVRLDAHNINYHIPMPEQPNGSCNKVVFVDSTSVVFKTTRPIKMVYTVDGSEPTSTSTVYDAPIKVSKTTTIRIASMMPSGKMSPVRTILVEKQAYAPAKDVATTQAGLNMKVTKGTFFNSSDLKDVKDWKTSQIKSLNELSRVVKGSSSMRNVEQASAVAQGYVMIPADGVYYFSSNNTEVWIDGKLLIDNNGEVKRFSRNDSSVALSKGLHEIKVVFLGHIYGGWPSSWDSADVNYRKADSDKWQKISSEMLRM